MVPVYFYAGVTNKWLLCLAVIVGSMVLYRVIDVDFKRSVFVPLLDGVSEWFAARNELARQAGLGQTEQTVGGDQPWQRAAAVAGESADLIDAIPGASAAASSEVN
jgi:hypothetical protein